MTQSTPLDQLQNGKLPDMVHWYNPRLLSKIAIRTAISSVFGQYADQRLVQAATDPGTEADIVSRYDYSKPGADPDKTVKLDETGALWVDYLADTGDGFETTYTMAYLLAANSLTVNNEDNSGRIRLTHGHILIMGGDQCYPQATREEYKKRLTTPFNWAFDVPRAERKLFAIPGNHDWYDGLNAFDSLFCSSRDKLSHSKGEKIGGWQCHQHRSYWAMKLPHDWWIWGTDIQFSKFLDSTQVSYFESMAARMKPGDKLVLCIAEPSWLLADFGKGDDEENFFAITRIARQAGAKIVAVIAGDWHVYSRYYNADHDVHFITAGGGGAFLHPTHVLKNEIQVSWPKQAPNAKAAPEAQGGYGPPAPGWTKETVDIRMKISGAKAPVGQAAEKVGEVLSEAKEIAREAAHDVAEGVQAGPIEKALRGKHKTRQKDAKCYPSRGRSAWLSLGNLAFPLFNKWFAALIGVIYWLITWEYYSLVTQHDISAGAIDAVGTVSNGKYVGFWDVYKYTPFYIVQGVLVSLFFAFLLAALYGGLVYYVDAGNRRPVARFLRKFIVGTTHFAMHVAAMFAIALGLVQWHNSITPTLHRYAENLWQTSAKDTTSPTAAVTRKVLEPLSKERQQDVRRYQEASESNATATRRAPPPVERAPSASNTINIKSFRQIVGFVLYPIEMILAGGLIGGFLFGLYWVVTGLLLRMHAEDAFAALRLKDYKNFLRMKVERDQLTIYPIGIDDVPAASFWTGRPDPKKAGAKPLPSHQPQLVAPRDIPVRLIERPIVIRPGDATA